MSLHYDGLPLALRVGEGMVRGLWYAEWHMRRPGTEGAAFQRVGAQTFNAVSSGWFELTDGTPRDNFLVLRLSLQDAADELRKPIRGDS